MSPRDDPNDPGVPLARYLGTREPHAVGFHCRGCGNAFFCVPVQVVIDDLKRRGVGDGTTGVRAVRRFVRKPCVSCGGRDFETRPHMMSTADRTRLGLT